MHQLLTSQYDNIKGARSALFNYCESIENDNLFRKIEVFNDSSIIDLLVHNANTYLSWISNFGMDGALPYYISDDVTDLNGVRDLFEKVDLLVAQFLKKYSGDYEQPLTKTIAHKGITLTLTPLQLFTHVTTHEFHHKGQILTMSRILGYIPADTDVIRF